ncbi:hypothetical protein L1887_32307 [Cichorium endivia]|nr:hypothetical protein L1887_32307 [Cichorium endivia]
MRPVGSTDQRGSNILSNDGIKTWRKLCYSENIRDARNKDKRGQEHWVLLVELNGASVRGRVLSNGEYYVAVAHCGVLMISVRDEIMVIWMPKISTLGLFSRMGDNYGPLYDRNCRINMDGAFCAVMNEEFVSSYSFARGVTWMYTIFERIIGKERAIGREIARRLPDLEFQVGNSVLLKVSSWNGVIRFTNRGKLGPRYIGPYRIIARVCKVAYQVKLPEQLG